MSSAQKAAKLLNLAHVQLEQVLYLDCRAGIRFAGSLTIGILYIFNPEFLCFSHKALFISKGKYKVRITVIFVPKILSHFMKVLMFRCRRQAKN
jgi:hypothetical protein